MATATGSPRARALSAALREARKERGISTRELAHRLSIDQSHLSRIETGKRVPSIETTAMILAILRTSREERERILDLARNASEPNWLTVGIPGIPLQLAGAWECERAASDIAAWHPCLIPGLLQTTDYARAIVVGSARLDKLPQHEIESRVMVKVARREVLTSRNPVRFNALIAEFALREPIGPSGVMAEQLRHLIKISEQSNVVIRVVPQRVGWHPGSPGPFVFYEFKDAPPVVHFEHHSSGAFDQDEDDIKAYRKAVAEIGKIALCQSEAIELIARIIVDEWS
ncbi:helix-turn-helix domain-containing protein [Saccharopolyspora phatthalungensis]|uniref:Transcriptional regulator with XRE-family HTH domain n=1 Tax=Saccharopolyspora phatthalungensis TaxID=664693 RepID=A0A840QD92_9PSEU|nr:helix-turn-helix transcriptional regulator [Saccharopolyspora phatthalungensis]MBB5154913.1 transcriptional regulator with XRE-family HTH domain [Saccharopolyspora phatthalungensis]